MEIMADSAFKIFTQIIDIVKIGTPINIRLTVYCRYFHSYIDAYDVIYSWYRNMMVIGFRNNISKT